MRTFRLLLIACLFLASGLTAANAQTDPQPIKIGFVSDQSGIGFLFYQSQLAGLQIALAEINASGGILGRPVEFLSRDSQLRPELGATIARQFVLEDKVDFLLGPTSSSVALAITEIAKENKVIVAFHTSNSVALTTTKGHPYMMQLVPNTTIEARAAARLASSLPHTRWASIGADYSFGRDSFNAFKPRLVELNGQASVINEQWPTLGDRNLNPFITAMQGSAPEAVYSNLWGDQLLTFVQQAEPLGLFEDSTFIGLFDMDVVRQMTSVPGENIYGYARAPFYGVDSDAMNNFVSRHRALAGGQYPADWAIMTYDAVMALKAAAEKAGTTDGEAIAKVLDEGLSFAALRGELTIRPCDRMANVGEYVGKLGMDSRFPFPILTNVQFVPAEELWNSCEEIEEMRKSAN